MGIKPLLGPAFLTFFTMTVRKETHSLLFGGTFFCNRTDRVFFQSLGEKNKKQKFVTRNPGNTMGVSGYGSFFCLWAVRARSAQGRNFTEPWVTPPTAGAMKIERGVVYNPTIHHGNLLEKSSSWAPPAMASTAAYRPSAAVPLKGTH
jgi:hypothetical protein